MYYRRLYLFTIILLSICSHTTGKKIKKNKRQKENLESTTIEPNVVTYSTFGFNDVGSYDGFVPTSPEYSSFLSGGNRETSTRLYAPAFPSATDTTGFSGNYGSQSFDRPTFGVNKDEVNQSGMSPYTSNSINFISSPNFVPDYHNKNAEYDSINNQNSVDSDAPVYGTKINARHKSKNIYPNGNIDFTATSNTFPFPTASNNYFNVQETEQSQEKPAFSELNVNKQNIMNYFPNFPTQETETFGKIDASNGHNVFNFPRVVDFTNLSNKYYPTELDTSKLTPGSMSYSSQQTSMMDSPMNNISNKYLSNPYNSNKIPDSAPTSFEEHYSHKNNEDLNKQIVKSNTYMNPEITHNHIASYNKNSDTAMKNLDRKKKIKYKPWTSSNHSNAIKDWKDASSSLSTSVKGYGYSTNYSNMNFRYDTSEPQKAFNPDEIIPASSNVIDATAYKFSEMDYSKFKKMPNFDDFEEYVERSQYKDKFKSGDYLNQFRNPYNEVQTTTSSYWGNNFKSTDYSSFRDHAKKPYAVTENNQDDIVNIPKRPHKFSISKPSQNKAVDWPSDHHRPLNSYRPMHDWHKDFLDTRYKSEEDLLGLRTHDTSHPSYLPIHKPNTNVNNDDEFKQLVEKWKQSYIKAKYKDMPVRGYESYGSEVKPYHVPILKPYPIEVPHPVIVPVPRPFPVRVPITKPVAVPVLQEITVPIEKPVPYPIYKNVPYPVEKPVSVPVEKEVIVPVEKPYPVHIPHIRPVFHHSKPVHEEPEHYDEEDYLRRPDHKRPSHYKKRTVYSTRNNKSRRPSRASYQDRNRRRWPDRRRPSGYNPEHRHTSRPNGFQHAAPYKRPSFDHELDEDEHQYEMYCRHTGKC